MANSSTLSIISATGPYDQTFGEMLDLVKAADIDEFVYSRAVCVIGITDESDIKIVSGNGSYKINSGDWTGLDGVINNGDFVFARIPRPTESNTGSLTEFSIGGSSYIFFVSTAGYVVTPDETTYIVDGSDFVVDGSDFIIDGV